MVSHKNIDYMYNFERFELFMNEELNKKIKDVMSSMPIFSVTRSDNYLQFNHADGDKTFDLDDLEMFRKYGLPVKYVDGAIAVCEHGFDMSGYYDENKS